MLKDLEPGEKWTDSSFGWYDALFWTDMKVPDGIDPRTATEYYKGVQWVRISEIYWDKDTYSLWGDQEISYKDSR